ncbi:MAG: leucine-rich repeat domain-containing protein [Lachnospiraceae bacterium]
MKNLEVLDLSGNEVSDISVLENMENMQMLDLLGLPIVKRGQSLICKSVAIVNLQEAIANWFVLPDFGS